MKNARKRWGWSGLLAAGLVMLACGSLEGLTGPDPQEVTAQALSTAIESTRLSEAIVSTSEANASATVKALPTTPAPTVTPLPTITPDAAATAAVEATESPIRQALSSYGIDPSLGRLGWVHNTVTIELDTYGAQNYSTDYPNVITRNFVIQSDVTWTTKTGLAGCGYVFRADQQQNFYGMGIFRGATGVAGFSEYAEGRNVNNSTEFRDAPATLWRNGDTNRLALVAQEDLYTFYVNGQLTHQISDPTLQAGGVAFAALSESGTSICTFTNGWLWILD